jgi:TusA-related sulfurtransferase
VFTMAGRQGKQNAKSSVQSEHQVKRILDLRGMIIPLTLLKITQGLRKMGAGETMEVIGTDPDTRRDVLRVLGTSHCKVLSVRDENDHYLIRLKKEKNKEG